MARTTKNTTAKRRTPITRPTLHTAKFNIAGTINGVYEGEKYDYVALNVDSENINPKTNEPYYNTFSVACPKSMEIPDDGEEVRIIGDVQSFYNKDRQRTEYAFYGVEIYGINDAVDLDTPFDKAVIT